MPELTGRGLGCWLGVGSEWAGSLPPKHPTCASYRAIPLAGSYLGTGAWDGPAGTRFARGGMLGVPRWKAWLPHQPLQLQHRPSVWPGDPR